MQLELPCIAKNRVQKARLIPLPLTSWDVFVLDRYAKWNRIDVCFQKVLFCFLSGFVLFFFFFLSGNVALFVGNYTFCKGINFHFHQNQIKKSKELLKKNNLYCLSFLCESYTSWRKIEENSLIFVCREPAATCKSGTKIIFCTVIATQTPTLSPGHMWDSLILCLPEWDWKPFSLNANTSTLSVEMWAVYGL